MKVRLGAGDEEGTCLVQHIQAREIDVAAIHDVDCPRLGQQEIEGMNVVQFTLGDVDETRDAPAQIKQGVHLHRRLGGAKVRPRKQRQAQIDGDRVQSMALLWQI